MEVGAGEKRLVGALVEQPNLPTADRNLFERGEAQVLNPDAIPPNPPHCVVGIYRFPLHVLKGINARSDGLEYWDVLPRIF